MTDIHMPSSMLEPEPCLASINVGIGIETLIRTHARDPALDAASIFTAHGSRLRLPLLRVEVHGRCAVAVTADHATRPSNWCSVKCLPCRSRRCRFAVQRRALGRSCQFSSTAQPAASSSHCRPEATARTTSHAHLAVITFTSTCAQPILRPRIVNAVAHAPIRRAQ